MSAVHATTYPAASPRALTLNDFRLRSEVADEQSSKSSVGLTGMIVVAAIAVGAFLYFDPLGFTEPKVASQPPVTTSVTASVPTPMPMPSASNSAIAPAPALPAVVAPAPKVVEPMASVAEPRASKSSARPAATESRKAPARVAVTKQSASTSNANSSLSAPMQSSTASSGVVAAANEVRELPKLAPAVETPAPVAAASPATLTAPSSTPATDGSN